MPRLALVRFGDEPEPLASRGIDATGQTGNLTAKLIKVEAGVTPGAVLANRGFHVLTLSRGSDIQDPLLRAAR